MKPLIAVAGRNLSAGRVTGWREQALGAPAPYLEALHRAGATEAVLLPAPITQAEATERLSRFDGLLLMGGGDVNPTRYGEEPRPEVGGVDNERDEFELALVRAALDRGLPVLAVCRGMQILNVSLGGTLVQHIDNHPVPHHGENGNWALHPVRVDLGTRLELAVSAEQLHGSASHHQAVARLGEGLHPTAWAADEIVEAVELDADPWVVGVQWHPERTAHSDPQQQRLFDGLVRQA